jgi:hypothetical protein
MSIELMFEDVKPKRIRSSGLRIDELRYESCRYIISSETALSVRYCGHEKKRGAYCSFHAELCYLPPKSKKNEIEASGSL